MSKGHAQKKLLMVKSVKKIHPIISIEWDFWTECALSNWIIIGCWRRACLLLNRIGFERISCLSNRCESMSYRKNRFCSIRRSCWTSNWIRNLCYFISGYWIRWYRRSCTFIRCARINGIGMLQSKCERKSCRWILLYQFRLNRHLRFILKRTPSLPK